MEQATVDITSGAFGARLAAILRAARQDQQRSLRAVASASRGSFRSRTLKELEAGRADLRGLDLAALAALYRIDLAALLQERVPLVVDVSAGTISTAGVARTFEPGHPDGLLLAYLHLVRDLRDLPSAPSIALRREDVEVLAGGLRADAASVLDRLGELMGSTVTQRRSAIAMFAAGAALIVLSTGAIALEPGSYQPPADGDGGSGAAIVTLASDDDLADASDLGALGALSGGPQQTARLDASLVAPPAPSVAPPAPSVAPPALSVPDAPPSATPGGPPATSGGEVPVVGDPVVGGPIARGPVVDAPGPDAARVDLPVEAPRVADAPSPDLSAPDASDEAGPAPAPQPVDGSGPPVDVPPVDGWGPPVDVPPVDVPPVDAGPGTDLPPSEESPEHDVPADAEPEAQEPAPTHGGEGTPGNSPEVGNTPNLGQPGNSGNPNAGGGTAAGDGEGGTPGNSPEVGDTPNLGQPGNSGNPNAGGGTATADGEGGTPGNSPEVGNTSGVGQPGNSGNPNAGGGDRP